MAEQFELGRLQVALGADPRPLARDFNKAGRKVDGFSKQVTKMKGVLLTALGGAAVVGAFRSVLRAWTVQEDAIASLRGALIATGREGGGALEGLTRKAAQLQLVTRQGDEAIIAATATLAQLAQNLRPAELERAQSAIIGIAETFTRGNLESAAQLVGKSIGSTTNALTRYGIMLDTAASEGEKLNQIVAQSDTFFAVAQSRTETLAGATTQLANAWGDAQESLGGFISKQTGLMQLLQSMTVLLQGGAERVGLLSSLGAFGDVAGSEIGRRAIRGRRGELQDELFGLRADQDRPAGPIRELLGLAGTNVVRAERIKLLEDAISLLNAAIRSNTAAVSTNTGTIAADPLKAYAAQFRRPNAIFDNLFIPDPETALLQQRLRGLDRAGQRAAIGTLPLAPIDPFLLPKMPEDIGSRPRRNLLRRATQAPLPPDPGEAAGRFSAASVIAIAAFDAMAQAAIRGGAQMELAIVSAIGQIILALLQMKASQGSSALGFGGAIGGAAASLFSETGIVGTQNPQGTPQVTFAVQALDGDSALRVLRKNRGEIVRIVTDAYPGIVDSSRFMR